MGSHERNVLVYRSCNTMCCFASAAGENPGDSHGRNVLGASRLRYAYRVDVPSA